jgi:hypothetical protein
LRFRRRDHQAERAAAQFDRALARAARNGLVERAKRGQWTVVDADLPEAPPKRWTEPLSGKRVARHAADGRVRKELSMA